MRTWARKAAALLAALLALCGAARAQTQLMVVSDLHYMAPSLYEGSELFIRALRAGDGKLSQQGEALMDALALEVARIAPDALIITGDLSFNGERASHEALAARLAAIEAGGTPVWVIPGNHDINSPTPRGFRGDGWYAVESVDEAAFAGLYADFLLPPTEGANLSYVAEVSDGLWVAMTDVSFYRDMAQTFGLFTAGHARWLESAMERAAASGAELVTATHHSLLPHTDFSRDSFLMFGHEQMLSLALERGLRLNLSGHLHAQHIARQGGLADAALGAFCLWPHRYALVTLEDGGGLSYEAKALDADLLPEGFQDMSRAWFAGITGDKTRAALEGEGLLESELDAMVDYATRFTLAFFSGTYRLNDPSWREDPAYTLWLAHSDSPIWQYMSLVMNEPGGENLSYCAG